LRKFLSNYELPFWDSGRISFTEIKAFLKILWKIGLLENGRGYFWRLLLFSLFKYPAKLSLAMTFVVYGYHFRRIAAAI
jgi:hypothetical protein